MAAAEYFQMSQQNLAAPQNHAPPPEGPVQNPPYPLSDNPPPYESLHSNPRPHSQPPPNQRPAGPPQYQAYNPSSMDTHQYPPEKIAQQQRPQVQPTSRPSDFTSSHPPPPPPPQQPPYQHQNGSYFAPAGVGLSQIYNNQQRPQRSSSTTGYPTAQSPCRKDSRSRSRSRDRRRRHHHTNYNNYNGHNGYPRPLNEKDKKKKGSGVNTFLGAGGGALVGDLIFPGLGTLGGAILGGVGGHEYDRKRTQSNPNRREYRRSASNYVDTYEDEYRRGRK